MMTTTRNRPPIEPGQRWRRIKDGTIVRVAQVKNIGTVSSPYYDILWDSAKRRGACSEDYWYPKYELVGYEKPPEPFDFVEHLKRQHVFSQKTFGPGPRTKGVLDHIRKELREIEAEPTDLTEWMDLAILALDGALRAGHTPQQIADQLVATQERNERREWPDWRTADPDKAIEHVRHPLPEKECGNQ